MTRQTTKRRYQLFLSGSVADRFEALARRPGMNKSVILQDALEAWLDRRGGDELDDHFGQRLNRLSNQINRIERDQLILMESLALFIRVTLLRDAHLPEPDAAERALARERFDAFVTQVGRYLAKGAPSLQPNPIAGDV